MLYVSIILLRRNIILYIIYVYTCTEIALSNILIYYQDHLMLNRSKSQEENVCYPTIKIVQKKEYWYKVNSIYVDRIGERTSYLY